MGFKRILRDLVFLLIAINLIRMGGFTQVLYGLIIAGFTLYFYFGNKY